MMYHVVVEKLCGCAKRKNMPQIKSFDDIEVVCLNVKDCKNREYRSGGIVSDKSNYLPESK